MFWLESLFEAQFSGGFVLLIVYRSQENRSDFLNECYVLASDLVTGHLYLSLVRPLI